MAPAWVVSQHVSQIYENGAFSSRLRVHVDCCWYCSCAGSALGSSRCHCRSLHQQFAARRRRSVAACSPVGLKDGVARERRKLLTSGKKLNTHRAIARVKFASTLRDRCAIGVELFLGPKKRLVTFLTTPRNFLYPIIAAMSLDQVLKHREAKNIRDPAARCRHAARRP